MLEKKSMLQLLSSIVVMVLFLASVPPDQSVANAANPFSDALSERYQADVMELHEKGIIGGFPDGSFRADSDISRGAAALMLARALGYVDVAGDPLIETDLEEPSFSDVHNGTSYYNAIIALEDQDIISGNPDGTFGPNDEVTRGAMAIMLANGFELNPHSQDNPFTDIGASSRDAVQALFDYGITSGTSNTTYGTDNRMIRADFAVMVNASIHADRDGETSEMDGVDLSLVAPGTPETEVKNILGEPDRTESHFLGYEWWIYNDPLENYVQVAVYDGVVEEVYSLSELAHYQDISIDDSENHVVTEFPHETGITLRFDNQSYQLFNAHNRGEEGYLATSEEYIAKFDLDQHENNQLTGIRLMSNETAVKMNYFGYSRTRSGDAEDLHERPTLTDNEKQAVNRSNDRIMHDLVNVNRDRHELSTLSLRNDISEVAYSHSVDMYENGFFSHTSPTTGGPSDRMQSAGLTGHVAENIAMGQRDAIEANAALMNSTTGHRQSLLNSNYSAIGIGSHENHYTQKFIR